MILCFCLQNLHRLCSALDELRNDVEILPRAFLPSHKLMVAVAPRFDLLFTTAAEVRDIRKAAGSRLYFLPGLYVTCSATGERTVTLWSRLSSSVTSSAECQTSSEEVWELEMINWRWGEEISEIRKQNREINICIIIYFCLSVCRPTYLYKRWICLIMDWVKMAQQLWARHFRRTTHWRSWISGIWFSTQQVFTTLIYRSSRRK